MKHVIPSFDDYLNEMRQKSGAFANVYIDKGIVVKFTKDESEVRAWNRLLESNIYRMFPQTPKIYGIYASEKTADRKYVIVMEEIKMLSDNLADDIEEDLLKAFDTTYIEQIILDPENEKNISKLGSYTQRMLTYCNEYYNFCKKNDIHMNVMEIQNIGMKNTKFAFYDMGECRVDGTAPILPMLDSKSNDPAGIAKELILQYRGL